MLTPGRLFRVRPAVAVSCPDCHGTGLNTPDHKHADPDTCSTCMDAPACEACVDGEVPGPAACSSCWADNRQIFAAEPGTTTCRACRELAEEADEAARSVA